VARVRGLADADLPIRSPLIKQSKSLGLVLGENAGESFALAQLRARSDEVAEQIVKVLEGFYAMAAPDARPLLSPTKRASYVQA
jgi:hypothetical protein